MSLRKLKVAMVLFLVLQMLVPSAVLAAAIGEFTAVQGEVSQTTAGAVIRPAAKSPVQERDLIVTGNGATAVLAFKDESVISLAPNSRFEVKSFHLQDNGRKGLFSLALGKITAEVKKFVGGGSTFEVETPTAVAGVRGTGFELVVAMVGGQMATTVTCTVGAVSVSAISAAGITLSTVTLVAGQTAIVTTTGITVSAVAVGTAGVGAGTGGAGAAGAAGTAGAAAGTAATAGVTVGTVAVGVAAAAATAAVIVSSSGGETTTTHHATTSHH